MALLLRCAPVAGLGYVRSFEAQAGGPPHAGTYGHDEPGRYAQHGHYGKSKQCPPLK
jgi:hypothetical protein